MSHRKDDPDPGFSVSGRIAAVFVRRAPWLLAGAFVLPNIGALFCRFVYDDFPYIVDNSDFHSFGRLGELWLLTLRFVPQLRPVSRSVWTLLWVLGGGEPWVFHLFNLVLGAVVVLLLHRLFLMVNVAPVTAFVAAALFALFPIHTEVTTAVVGATELLAAALSLGSLVMLLRGRRATALLLFAAALLSKESAAAMPVLAAFALREHKKPLKAYWPDALVATALVGYSALTNRVLLAVPSAFSVLDNAAVQAPHPVRILTALWVQCLYIIKTFLPLRLSADYSYNQIPLVTGFLEPRALAGLALAACALAIVALRGDLRKPLLMYAALFLPTANLLYPIGVLMGERLVYLPSAGLALFAAVLLVRTRYWPAVLLVAALCYGGRTAIRNQDWQGAETLYPSLLQTAPNSARSHYLYGDLLAFKGDDAGAIRSYDRSIEIFAGYAPVHFNRGNALTRLGRIEEAMGSYRSCLSIDPSFEDAARMLELLRDGVPVFPGIRPF